MSDERESKRRGGQRARARGKLESKPTETRWTPPPPPPPPDQDADADEPRSESGTTIVQRQPDAPTAPTVVHAEIVPDDEPGRPWLDPRAREFAEKSVSDNTERAFRFQWDRFTRWCAIKGLKPLPAASETVASYLTYLAKFGEEPELDKALGRDVPLKAASIKPAITMIDRAHKLAGAKSVPSEGISVKVVWEGIRRTLGTKKAKRTPILAEDMVRIISLVPTSELIGLRDKALLLLGWSGAFRRSELVGLDVEDLFPGEEGGLVAFVRKSKTDQYGTGKMKPITPAYDETLCPVRNLRRWLASSGIASGPLFRPFSLDKKSMLPKHLSDDMVYEVVLKYAEEAGLDPGPFAGFGGHSLRAGFITAAFKAGKSPDQIMKVTGQRKIDTLLEYERDVELFSKRAAGWGLLDHAAKAKPAGQQPDGPGPPRPPAPTPSEPPPTVRGGQRPRRRPLSD